MIFRKTVTAILSAAVIIGSAAVVLPQTADSGNLASAASALKLSSSAMSLGKGESVKLTANQSVKWRTSSSKILTVDQKGEVTSVSLDKTALSLSVGSSAVLTASVTPENATNKTITWSSGNSSVATVKDGKVTAVAPGTAVITAASYNGKTAKCTVTVLSDLENSSYLGSASVYTDTPVTIYGKASGGTAPYKYAFYYKRSTNTKWNVIGTEFGSAESVTFTSGNAADFDIKVIAKDSSGAKAEKLLSLRVTENQSFKNTSWINTEIAQIGNDVRVTGAAEGGEGSYTYAFYFKRSSNSKWNRIGTEFGDKKYAVLVPSAAASYDMKVIAKDEGGNMVTRTFTVNVVKSLELTNISTLTATSVAPGKTVTLAGRVIGGTKPCTFEFYFKRSANSKWNKLSYGNDAGTYAKFTPTTSAEFDLKVVAYDAAGAKSEKLFKLTAESDAMGKTKVGAVPYTISESSGYYKPDGTFTDADDYACGYATVSVNEGDVFLYKGRGTGNAVSVIFYDSSDKIVETKQFDETRYHEIIIPGGVTKAFFTSGMDLKTAARLTFELHYNGSIKKSEDSDSSYTLKTADRLSACMTLGQAEQIRKLDRAVVCIGFDDYNLDCLEGVQYLNSQNLKSYLALIPDKVTDDWNMAHVCYDNGGEIAAHSRITLTASNQTTELMNEKFIKLPSIIRENGFPVYGIIRAGGAGVGTESRILDELYCRAAGLRYSDYYGTVNPYRLTRENMTHRTLQEWKSYFDDLVTNKEYVILYCHHLDGSEKNAYPDGFTFSDFTGIVREIQSRNIDVMTINEFVDRYIYGVSDSGTSAR